MYIRIVNPHLCWLNRKFSCLNLVRSPANVGSVHMSAGWSLHFCRSNPSTSPMFTTQIARCSSVFHRFPRFSPHVPHFSLTFPNFPWVFRPFSGTHNDSTGVPPEAPWWPTSSPTRARRPPRSAAWAACWTRRRRRGWPKPTAPRMTWPWLMERCKDVWNEYIYIYLPGPSNVVPFLGLFQRPRKVGPTNFFWSQECVAVFRILEKL